MTTPRRRHRRVRKTWTGCRCPPGSKRVSTCKKLPDGTQVCRGRGWGCLGLGVSQKGKSAPRFLAALCDSPSDMATEAPKRKPGRPRKPRELVEVGPVPKLGVPAPEVLPRLTAREQARMLPQILKAPRYDAVLLTARPEPRAAKEVRAPKPRRPKQLKLKM